MDVKLKVFMKDDKDFRPVQNLTIGETDFSQVMRLQNQLIVAPETLRRGENLSPVKISTLSKDLDELLKPAHKVVEVVDRANRKVCVTMQRYSVEKPGSSNAQVHFF